MRVYEILENRPALEDVPSAPLSLRGVAGFWRLRGHRVFADAGVMWGEYKHGIFVNLPFHQALEPQASEIRSMLVRHNAAGVRYPSLGGPGASTGLYYCCPHGYDVGSISRKIRAGVRSGLDNCVVKPVPLDDLESEGIPLNLDTMRRQNRFDREFGDPAAWRRFVNAIRNCADVSVMGTYVEGHLSAYKISCRDGEWIHQLYMASRTDEMRLHTNHVLDFSCLAEAGRDPSVKAVGNWYPTNGVRPGIDHYKEHFGFRMAPHNFCYQLHPVLSVVADNRLAVSVASAFSLPAAELLKGVQLSHMQHIESQDPCQQTDAPRFSRPWRPHLVFLAWWYSTQLRKQGLAAAFRKAGDKIGKRLRGVKPAVMPRPDVTDEVLFLHPGDWVEVKSEAEIRGTLDKAGKNRGLLFNNEMRPFYGKKFRVFKRLERMFLEESRQNRKLKNTVLLEGVHCSGVEMQCDRACFLYWREVWLRRSTPPEPVSNPLRVLQV